MSLPASHAAATSSTALCSASCNSGVNWGSVQGLECTSTSPQQLRQCNGDFAAPRFATLGNLASPVLASFGSPPLDGARDPAQGSSCARTQTLIKSGRAHTRYPFLTYTQNELCCARTVERTMTRCPRLVGLLANRAAATSLCTLGIKCMCLI